jgi:hypothetical protein
LLGRRRLFLCRKTTSNWTTPSGYLPTLAAPHKGEGFYHLPAFDSADRVTSVEGFHHVAAPPATAARGGGRRANRF